MLNNINIKQYIYSYNIIMFINVETYLHRIIFSILYIIVVQNVNLNIITHTISQLN